MDFALESVRARRHKWGKIMVWSRVFSFMVVKVEGDSGFVEKM